jgi:hypothetical protein
MGINWLNTVLHAFKGSRILGITSPDDKVFECLFPLIFMDYFRNPLLNW